MIDVRLIRSDPDAVKSALGRRGEDLTPIDRVIELDRRQRDLTQERDEIRHQVKALSKEVGGLRKAGETERAEALQAESRALGEREAALAEEADARAEEVLQILLLVPNLPSPDAPDGASEGDNPVLRQGGPDPDNYAEHQQVPHWETGETLGILDFERGVKLAGSMFVAYRGLGATVARALCQLALDRNADLYEEVRPPSLVRTEIMVGTGQLPKFHEDAYHLERDDLWAVPTAEVPLTSLYRDEILDEDDLPMRFMAYSPCFRREAGSAGRDTRGLLRVHEFDKVELLALTTPDQAPDLQAEIMDRAEALVGELGLSHRVIDICTGDMGIAHHRSWDLEVWSPGVGQWLEASSVSWLSDYQARRANLRYRPAGAKGTELLHTLNGSGLAVPRVLAALLEVHRREDGSVALPEPLHPYLRGATEIALPA
ncbi:MAG: serine--tRNA ligase [Acidimicrobiales bacterium]